MSQKPPAPDPEPLAPLVDAHTHLASLRRFTAAEIATELDRAAAVGVRAVVTVANDLDDARHAATAATLDNRVYAALAIHPTHADQLDAAAKTELTALAAGERVVAIGETGLDYYWPGRAEWAADVATQQRSFRWHIDLAKSIGKPLMIHNREADADVIAILDEVGAPETVIMHCFSGDVPMAEKCAERGFMLSFSGTVTFKNSAELQRAARLVPAELLLVETDAPFLAPHPYRGSRNAPYLLPYTARFLADLRGLAAPEMARILTANSERVYGIVT